MKALYEVRNGYMGESYVRAYVWCDSVEQAKQMALALGDKWDEGDLQVELLFTEDRAQFITLPSDSGWFEA